MSRPAGARGLKFIAAEEEQIDILSRPAGARGLKFVFKFVQDDWYASRPAVCSLDNN